MIGLDRRYAIILLMTTIILFLIGCDTLQKNQILLEQEIQKDKIVDEDRESIDSMKNITKIELILDTNGPYWNDVKPILIKDSKIINDIMAMIKESKPLIDDYYRNRWKGKRDYICIRYSP